MYAFVENEVRIRMFRPVVQQKQMQRHHKLLKQ